MIWLACYQPYNQKYYNNNSTYLTGEKAEAMIAEVTFPRSHSKLETEPELHRTCLATIQGSLLYDPAAHIRHHEFTAHQTFIWVRFFLDNSFRQALFFSLAGSGLIIVLFCSAETAWA